MISASYGRHSLAIGSAIAEARAAGLMRRIREQDHTVWSPEPEGIADRLGWLRAPSAMKKEVGRIVRFAAEAADRFDDVLILGMGGSSLAAEAFAHTFGDDGEGLRLRVVDTTDPDAIGAIARSVEPTRTLHVVATKSGTTVETLAAFRFFHERLRATLQERETAEGGSGARDGVPGSAGAHFAAITDPGTSLSRIARDLGFREVFLNPQDVGGRFSALTYFGLVPAALTGAFVAELLERAEAVMKSSLDGVDGRALGLGVALGVLAREGRDKLTISTSPEIASFAAWLEQLVAESTGKAGTGIVPVTGEPLSEPAAYGDDRVFVDLALADDGERDDALADLERSGQPVLRVGLRDRYDIGGQIALWELAVSVAAAQLGVNPFDQPDVESAKVRAREAVQAFRDGESPPPSPTAPPSPEALLEFLAEPRPPAYVALQAYLPPSPELDDALRALRVAIRARYGVATTADYGPRFLHSTGQLHKGGAPRGRFVQLTAEPHEDFAIPEPDGAEQGRGAGEAELAGADTGGRATAGADAGGGPGPRRVLTFGALEAAQAAGDRRALDEAGKRVLRIDLGGDAVRAIRALADGIAEGATD